MRRPTAQTIIDKSEPRYGENAPRATIYPSAELMARMKAACAKESLPGRPPVSLNAWLLGVVFDYLERTEARA